MGQAVRRLQATPLQAQPAKGGGAIMQECRQTGAALYLCTCLAGSGSSEDEGDECIWTRLSDQVNEGVAALERHLLQAAAALTCMQGSARHGD